MLKRILISLLILITVSSTFAIIFCDKTLWSFSKLFLVATVVQFIIQYLTNQFINAKYGVQITQLEATMAKELSRNVISVACPCHIHNAQDVDIDIHGENRYKCNKCNKEIYVAVGFTSALATTPVDTLKAEIALPVTSITQPVTSEQKNIQ